MDAVRVAMTVKTYGIESAEARSDVRRDVVKDAIGKVTGYVDVDVDADAAILMRGWKVELAKGYRMPSEASCDGCR